MNPIKIIALDLDGTLLDSRKQISKENYEALEKAAAEGIAIVPTTGRFFAQMPDCVRELPFVDYAITVNGACVYDVRNDTYIREASIPIKKAIRIMEHLDTIDCIYDAYLDNKAFLSASHRKRIPEFPLDEHYLQMWYNRIPVPDLKTFLLKKGSDIWKTQCLVKDMDLKAELLKTLPGLFEDILVTTSSYCNIEFNDIHANKGEALLYLAEYLGCSRENIMAFGDDLNDQSMIESAGIGIAMANSKEKILQIADDIVSDNDHHGIAEGIYKHCF